jgi:phosphofructokinase-like protein
MSRKIGILNGGGDCAGLNAVIAAIVKSGIDEGFEFIGIINSTEGLLSPVDYIDLDFNSVRGISHLGGTILKTTNKGKFSAKTGAGETQRIPNDLLNEVKSNVEKLGLESVIFIGGDGTLTGALQLSEIGVNTVGVPKTIDNDLNSTDMSFGFSTAVDFVAEALDRIHTTAASHNRVILVETMGRHAGWIALYGGVAGGAEIILVPEFKYNYDKIIEQLRDQRTKGKSYSIIVVAEGARADDEKEAVFSENQTGENHLGGISERIMWKIEQKVPGEFEMRNVVLGHLQRGGSPIATDRILANRFGVAAMSLAKNKDYGKMVALKGDDIVTVNIADAVHKLKLVTEDHNMIKTAKELQINFGI